MKVCIVNNAWLGTGVGRYVFEIFSEFKKMEKNVEMVYLQNRVPLSMHNEKIKILTTPFKFPIGMAAFNNYFYFPKKIPRGYDVYHISNHTIGKCCKETSVITCHDVFVYSFKKANDMVTSFFLKRHLKSLKIAKKIIAISEHTKKDIIDFLKIAEEKIEVIYYGVNAKQFKLRNKLKMRKRLNLPLDKKIILHVGQDSIRKNVATLIKAFYKLEKQIPDIMLIRMGDNPMKQKN